MQELKLKMQALRKEQPEIRARDAAEILGVSEGELCAAHSGEGVTRLVDQPEAILQSVVALGEVMALTRNECCVHERKGVYENASFFARGSMQYGQFVNADIDLRLFMNHWKYAFAVVEGTKKSLQFFDKSGTAIHKIYLTVKSNQQAFLELIETYRHQIQDNIITIEPYAPPVPDLADDDIDWLDFRKAWEHLQDIHDFHAMLRKFKVGRVQALRNIGSDFAYQVPNNAVWCVLELARDREYEIMVFVGNRGCLQIHTGLIKKLVVHGPWYNVLDPMFSLHLREDKIAHSWVVKKPTVDGIVTALELFDAENNIIATFFGKRKPGVKESDIWRDIINQVPVKELPHAA